MTKTASVAVGAIKEPIGKLGKHHRRRQNMHHQEVEKKRKSSEKQRRRRHAAATPSDDKRRRRYRKRHYKENIIAPPLNYPEAGINNVVLPASKVKTETQDQWVSHLFQPLSTPNQSANKIYTQQIQPVTLGLLYIDDDNNWN